MSIIPQNVQQVTPHEQNKGHEKHVETIVSTVVSSEEAKKLTDKRQEKAVLKRKQQKAVSTTGKKQKLCQVKDDIKTVGVGKGAGVGAGEGSEGAEEASGGKGGSLFGGFGDHWEADPLTTFMFENAPVIIKLCQRSQEAMMKAQVAQTKEQSQSALNNAKDTIAKGQAQAKQQTMQAAGEFAQAGAAALQCGLQMKDSFAGDNTFAKNLDAHDQVLDGLNKGSLENEVNAGGNEVAEEEDPRASVLDEADEAIVDAKVKEFQVAHKAAYEKAMDKRKGGFSSGNRNEKSFKTLLKKNFGGLNRTETSVKEENKVLSNREASEQAYNEVFGTKSTYENTDATSAVTTDKKFSDLMESGTDTMKGEAFQKRFMSKLFQEGEVGPNAKTPLSMKERMNYIGNWGGESCISSGDSIQQKMLKSYGSTKEGVAMSEKFVAEREIASQRANTETSLNRKILDTRNLILQTGFGQGAKAITDLLQKQYMIEVSKNEAGANLEATIGQMNSQAKGAEESFVANSLKDMTGIFEWFQNLHGQLLSAQAAASGA